MAEFKHQCWFLEFETVAELIWQTIKYTNKVNKQIVLYGRKPRKEKKLEITFKVTYRNSEIIIDINSNAKCFSKKLEDIVHEDEVISFIVESLTIIGTSLLKPILMLDTEIQNLFYNTDSLQYQKQLSDTEFYMLGANALPEIAGYVVYRSKIDISNYDESEKETLISGYYDTIEDFNSAYPPQKRSGIFAEIVFESQWNNSEEVVFTSNLKKAKNILLCWEILF